MINVSVSRILGVVVASASFKREGKIANERVSLSVQFRERETYHDGSGDRTLYKSTQVAACSGTDTAHNAVDFNIHVAIVRFSPWASTPGWQVGNLDQRIHGEHLRKNSKDGHAA